MKRIWLFKLALLGVGFLASTGWEARAEDAKPPEISFTMLKLLEKNVEGPDMERTYFPAGKYRIVFGQPKGCRVRFEGSRVVIFLDDAGLDGEIHVSHSPFTPQSDLAADVLKYRESAANNIPQGAANIEVQRPEMNTYPYNGWKSLGFTWNYVVSGRSMVRTVSYINLEIGTQIMVTTLAAKNDAEQVNKIARQFMSSWWVMSK